MNKMPEPKLPTVEQVETIIKEWGTSNVQEFCERFGLEAHMVEKTVACIRLLKRTDDTQSISPLACYRDDRLESIVRCAGARLGYK